MGLKRPWIHFVVITTILLAFKRTKDDPRMTGGDSMRRISMCWILLPAKRHFLLAWGRSLNCHGLFFPALTSKLHPTLFPKSHKELFGEQRSYRKGRVGQGPFCEWSPSYTFMEPPPCEFPKRDKQVWFQWSCLRPLPPSPSLKKLYGISFLQYLFLGDSLVLCPLVTSVSTGCSGRKLSSSNM